MKRKWSIENIKKLVKKAEAYKGKRSDFFKSAGIKASQYYWLRSKLNSRTLNTRRLPNKRVLQLISSGQAGASSGIELTLPSGHSVKIFGDCVGSVFPEIMNYLRAQQ